MELRYLALSVAYHWAVWDALRQLYANEHFYPQIRLLTSDGGLTYSDILDMPLPMLKGYTEYTVQQLKEQQAALDKARKKRK